MNIADKVYVSFYYTLTLESGLEVDKSIEGEPLGFVTGSRQMIPGLEKALMGMSVGDTKKVNVEPEEAYGMVNPEMFKEVPRDQFPADIEIKPGMAFQAQEADNDPFMVNIKEIKDENTVVIDLNHPLAGEMLTFDIKIVEVREPTAHELTGRSANYSG